MRLDGRKHEKKNIASDLQFLCFLSAHLHRVSCVKASHEQQPFMPFDVHDEIPTFDERTNFTEFFSLFYFYSTTEASMVWAKHVGWERNEIVL